MKKTLYDYCIENNRNYLISQWNDEKNVGLSMHDLSPGTHRSVWWKCELGHEWKSEVNRCPSASSA